MDCEDGRHLTSRISAPGLCEETMCHHTPTLCEDCIFVLGHSLERLSDPVVKCLPRERGHGVCLLVGCLTSQQYASVSQGRTCSDKTTCCHTEIEVADQTFYLTQSQYTDTGPTRHSTDPITPGAWQGSLWSAYF